MISVEMSPHEVAIMRSLARVAEKACARGALLAKAGWERSLYLRQEASHAALAARLEAVCPREALEYPHDAWDEPWDGLEG